MPSSLNENTFPAAQHETPVTCLLKEQSMIYLDNAATTMTKPPQVIQAVTDALSSFGGVGRGVHKASLDAGMTVYEAREAIAKFFNAPSASRVAFTSNATESLNIAISGLTERYCHVVTTMASHNSVLRTIEHMRKLKGIGATATKIASDGSLDYGAFERAFESGTKLAVVTHASNLTGDIYDIAELADIAHAYGALLIVDAAQTAGCVPVDMKATGADVICFTGHKGLMGPQGTGGIIVADGVEIPPFKVGGTGTHSFDLNHPTAMPESLEAGTLNGHGIAGLAAGVSFISKVGVDKVRSHELELVMRFEVGLRSIPDITVYGGPAANRTGIVALNVGTFDSSAVADVLSNKYGICTRAGAHCAPLMHKAIGTEKQGAVRFSFGWYNTRDDVDASLDALAQIARS